MKSHTINKSKKQKAKSKKQKAKSKKQKANIYNDFFYKDYNIFYKIIIKNKKFSLVEFIIG